MSALAYVLVAIGFITAASLVLYWRQRRPSSLEYGVERFNAGLRRLGERQELMEPDGGSSTGEGAAPAGGVPPGDTFEGRGIS